MNINDSQVSMIIPVFNIDKQQRMTIDVGFKNMESAKEHLNEILCCCKLSIQSEHSQILQSLVGKQFGNIVLRTDKGTKIKIIETKIISIENIPLDDLQTGFKTN
jgi:hypothetical protein